MSSAGLCPVCASRRTSAFFHLPSAPVTCASVFSTREQALAVPTGRIDLAVCADCGFVFNAAFDPRLGDVGARYESSQAASAHFSAFARSLAADWTARYGLKGRSILEVGCGSGAFLRQMLECGVANATGIDPLAPSGVSDEELGGAQLIFDVFDERYLDLEADALICRHTLEHIPDVSGFLGLIHQWAAARADRVVLFELPDAERIFAERAFWDIYYEHCSYFTLATLRTAFERCGFEVLRISRVYDDQYLVVEARPASAPAASTPSAQDVVKACELFAADVRASVERCQFELDRLAAAAPPLVLWQGAAKTVALLTTLPDASRIDSAIDLSPARHGAFLPGSGLPVHAPDMLPRLRPGTIVLMNPVYLTEVRQCVAAYGLTAPVLAINELLDARTG